MRQHTKAGSCHSCSHGQSFTAAAGCVHSAAVANFMSAQQAQSASFIPQATATYLSKPYWDERFANEDSYEWCKSFDEFGHLLRPHFKPFSSLLEIGAGNSSLSTTLAKELPSALICSLDISQVRSLQTSHHSCFCSGHSELQSFYDQPPLLHAHMRLCRSLVEKSHSQG